MGMLSRVVGWFKPKQETKKEIIVNAHLAEEIAGRPLNWDLVGGMRPVLSTSQKAEGWKIALKGGMWVKVANSSPPPVNRTTGEVVTFEKYVAIICNGLTKGDWVRVSGTDVVGEISGFFGLVPVRAMIKTGDGVWDLRAHSVHSLEKLGG